MTKSNSLFVFALLVLAFPLAAVSRAQDGSAADKSSLDSKVKELQERLDRVETQNRQLVQLLQELKARLDSPPQPVNANVRTAESLPALPAASASTVGSPPSAATAAQATTGSSKTSRQDQDRSKQGENVRWSELISEGNKLKFYGFMRLDMDMDSQRPNSGLDPLFITSPDSRVGGKPNNGLYTMSPRFTRLGIDFSGPRISAFGDAVLSGKLETDFDNGGTESREIIRIRLAYLKLNWGAFSVLAGQDWDTYSPLLPTVDNETTLWNAGNIGDRRPQFRAAYSPKIGNGRIDIAASVGLTGAIDSADLDGNGVLDGQESGKPDVQARVGFAHPLWVADQMASVGISGVYGWLNTAKPIAGKFGFRAQALNIDYTIPLWTRLSLRGEGWWGRNMSDFRGGAGQGLNLATGQPIRGRGGWSELAVKVNRFWSVYPGFSTDDPVDHDVPNGGRTRNHVLYVGNRFNLGRNFLIGADYLNWITNYKGLARGLDNRVNIFFQYGW
jgi:hypothetical protein